MTYFEQPDVRHMNEIIVWLYTDSKIYSFATTKSLNDYIDGSGEAGEELSPAFKVSPSHTPKLTVFCTDLEPRHQQRWESGPSRDRNRHVDRWLKDQEHRHLAIGCLLDLLQGRSRHPGQVHEPVRHSPRSLQIERTRLTRPRPEGELRAWNCGAADRIRT